MKKPLIFLFTLLLGRGISFAAPSPQYLEHLTTQILKQQTLTTTWKEVLDQLKSLFTQCASSHQDKAIEAVCKNFLEEQFPKLEKQWEKVLTGGFEVASLGKLTDEKRFSSFWLMNASGLLLKINTRFPVDQFKYTVVSSPALWFSFLVPYLPKADAGSGFYWDCETFKQSVKTSIDKMKRENPEYQKQIMDMEEGLANTQCYQSIKLQRFPRRTEDINISSPIDGIWNDLHVNISPRLLWEGETLEGKVQEECGSLEKASPEIGFNLSGMAYYWLDHPYLLAEAGKTLTGVVLWYTGDTSHLQKRTLGVGQNLQRGIEWQTIKTFGCNSHMYIQFSDQPKKYYDISFSSPSLLYGYYVGIDTYTSDETPSFLHK